MPAWMILGFLAVALLSVFALFIYGKIAFWWVLTIGLFICLATFIVFKFISGRGPLRLNEPLGVNGPLGLIGEIVVASLIVGLIHVNISKKKIEIKN
jgi:hypothetical protein